MRPNHFKKQTSFFHLNIHFKTTGYFKNLDWIYLQRLLHKISQKHSVEIQAFVMMDTHFHLLFECAKKNENFFCQDLEKELSNSADSEAYSEPIHSLSQYLAVCKYIYNNPVQANLCESVEQYPYSSIQILLGQGSGYCLISDKLGLIQNPQRILKWLNSDSLFKISKLNLQKDLAF